MPVTTTAYLPMKAVFMAVVPQDRVSSPLSLSPLSSIVNCSTLAGSFDDTSGTSPSFFFSALVLEMFNVHLSWATFVAVRT